MKLQVEVDELAKRIREEARRRREKAFPRPGPVPEQPQQPPSPTAPMGISAGAQGTSITPMPPTAPMPPMPMAAPIAQGPAVPPPPAFVAPDGAGALVDSLFAQLEATLSGARKKTSVGSGVPKFLRPFYRNQGGFNGSVLAALETLREANRQLRAENTDLHEHFARQSAWMTAAVRGFAALNARVADMERQGDHDRAALKTLEARAGEQSAVVEELRNRDGPESVDGRLERSQDQKDRKDPVDARSAGDERAGDPDQKAGNASQ